MISARMFQRGHGLAIKQAPNRALYVTHGHKCSYQMSFLSIFTKYRGMISNRIFKRGRNFTLHFNQSGVSILTKVYFFSLD